MSECASLDACQVSTRNPFRLVRLPWTCEQYLKLNFEPRRGGFLGHLRNSLRFRGLRMARRLLSNERGVFTVRIDGSERSIHFDPANTQFHSIYAPVYRHGYEPETATLIDLLLPRDGVMFDIGANWGHFSLFAASHPDFSGQIYAFEPMPRTFADLHSAITEAGLTERIHAHNLALSDSNGEIRMALPDGEHSGLATVTAGPRGTLTRMAALDSLGLPSPDLLKIDVEGHELAMLRGAAQTIRTTSPMIVFESTVTGSAEATLAPFFHLEEAGYSFFQPAIRRQYSHHPYFTDSVGVTEDQSTIELALIPLPTTERLLRSRHFNALACHKDRLHEVAEKFPKTILR